MAILESRKNDEIHEFIRKAFLKKCIVFSILENKKTRLKLTRRGVVLGDFQLSTFKGNIKDFSRHKLYDIISMKEKWVKGTHKERKKAEGEGKRKRAVASRRAN